MRQSLQEEGFAVDVWSVTSFVQLERDAQACARRNRLQPLAAQELPYVAKVLAEETGVFVAVTDYMRKLASGISAWVPGPYEVLGTDGYGLSEARPELRDHFEVSAKHITHASVATLLRAQLIDPQHAAGIFAQLDVDEAKINPVER